MRRADRLFQIIQLLRRRRRPITAAVLADRLGVSKRTIYRDVADLLATGVPIRGEAGVGYALSRSYDLPPLMFTQDELEALALGSQVVQAWADPDLAGAAESAIGKVRSVLPETLWRETRDSPLFALSFRSRDTDRANVGLMRRAIRERRRLELGYTDAEERRTKRSIRPLGLFFWGRIWTLAAWCELRQDFRSFRIDRIETVTDLGQTFEEEEGRSLRDLLRRYEDL